MSQKTLLIDMDGTLARFHDEIDYLERMFEEGFFESLAPFEKMVDGIRIFIRENPEVRTCTCSAAIQSPFCRAEKDAWIDKYLPEIPKENRIYTEVGRSKAEYLPDGAAKDVYLLDDYNRGLNQFVYAGGHGIKCHNNINQRGVGAHGGERGYMWEGAMIHADDPPALIAAELAQLMGLEHDIAKAAASCSVEYAENERSAKRLTRRRNKSLTQLWDKGGLLYAARNPRETYALREYFQNPFNALRYLNDDSLAAEYKLRTHEGEELRVSGYQLEAICQNAYGNSDFGRFMRADRTQLADDVQAALKHRDDAVVGLVCLVSADGKDFGATPYYSHAAMFKEIELLKRTGQGFCFEWFVEPPESTLICSKDSVHSSFVATLKNAIRRADNTGANVEYGKEPESR